MKKNVQDTTYFSLMEVEKKFLPKYHKEKQNKKNQKDDNYNYSIITNKISDFLKANLRI